MAHGYVCKFYGGEVHDIGVALLYFMPAFYCDTTDALLFPSKWHRLWVVLGRHVHRGLHLLLRHGAAGWRPTRTRSCTSSPTRLMLFTGVSTIFFNINPLRKIDGYYALSSVLEIPELREDSFEYLGALFKRHVLRLNVEVPRSVAPQAAHLPDLRAAGARLSSCSSCISSATSSTTSTRSTSPTSPSSC